MNKNKIEFAKEAIANYQKVEFHLKDGSIYHAKNIAEFKKLLGV